MAAKMIVSLLGVVACVLLARGVEGANSCNTAGRFLDIRAGMVAGRNNHDFQATLAAAGAGAGAAFQAAQMNQLAWMGSHDAGTYAFDTATTGYTARAAAPARPDTSTSNWAVTQTSSILDQLCAGSRMFDIRLHYTGGQWRIFHGNYYFTNVQDIVDQYALFLADHPGEIVFIRLKISGSVCTVCTKPTKKTERATMVIEQILARLESYVVGSGINKHTSTYAQVLAAPRATAGVGGRAFVMIYAGFAAGDAAATNPCPQWTPGVAGANTCRQLITDWTHAYDFTGTFSDRRTLSDITPRQFDAPGNLRASMNVAAAGRPIHSFWWTSTGNLRSLNVYDNQQLMWPALGGPGGQYLERLVAVIPQNCFGNVIVTDFVGNTAIGHTATVMQLIIAANGALNRCVFGAAMGATVYPAYAFLETGVSVTSSASMRFAARLRKATGAVGVLAANNDKAVTVAVADSDSDSDSDADSDEQVQRSTTHHKRHGARHGHGTSSAARLFAATGCKICESGKDCCNFCADPAVVKDGCCNSCMGEDGGSLGTDPEDENCCDYSE
jgi:hypothetical protein